MKKILIVLAVATVASAASGCCCGRVCPLCPCGWFNRGAYCPPAPTYAPMAAANPCCPQPCAPACTSWDPCQCAVVSQPGAQMGALPTAPVFGQAPCCQQGPNMLPTAPVFSQNQPMMMAGPTYYSEPGCGYMEPNCGMMSGPMMECGCGFAGGAPACSSGCCGDGGIPTTTGTAPEKFVDPAPTAE